MPKHKLNGQAWFSMGKTLKLETIHTIGAKFVGKLG